MFEYTVSFHSIKNRVPFIITYAHEYLNNVRASSAKFEYTETIPVQAIRKSYEYQNAIHTIRLAGFLFLDDNVPRFIQFMNCSDNW